MPKAKEGQATGETTDTTGLEGLPDDVRAQVQQAIEQEGAEEKPPTTPRQPAEAEAPAWAKDLIESNRVLQGQVRRYEQELARLQGTVEARQVESRRATEPDPFADLDMTDPAVRALVTAYKGMQSKVAALEGQAQRSTMTEQERREREYTIGQLREWADDLGVPLAALAGQLERLPTRELWEEGKKVIRQARKSATQPLDEKQVRQSERERVLRELNIWDESRAGIVTEPQNLDALDRLNEEFNQGKIKPEEFEKRQAALIKGVR